MKHYIVFLPLGISGEVGIIDAVLKTVVLRAAVPRTCTAALLYVGGVGETGVGLMDVLVVVQCYGAMFFLIAPKNET